MVNATTHRCPDGSRSGTGSASGRIRALRLCAVGLALAAGGALSGPDAFAQSKKAAKKAESAQPDQASAQRAYAAGTKLFDAGDMAGAEQQLSLALAGGGLPNAQMARALYLRGAAYRRLGRPAQAISDLTTAVWLKGGLSDADKAKATEERQLAYREAGLGDTPPPVGAAPLDQSPKTPATPPASGAQIVHVTEQSFWSNFSLPSIGGSSQPTQTAQTSTPPQQTQSSSFWSFLPSLGGSAQPEQAAAAAAPAAAPGAGFASDPALAAAASQGQGNVMLADAQSVSPTTAWETQTAATVGEAPAAVQPAAATAASSSYAPPPDTGLNPMGMAASDPAPAPSGGLTNPLAGTGTAVSNFFGNMFGSSSGEASPATADASGGAMATGSTAQSGGAWGPDTTVVTSQTSSMVQRGPDSPPPQPEALPWSGGGADAAPAPVRVAASGAAGRYKLQVAAVRSRDEAERLVQTLSGYQAVREGLVSAEIDEAVIGSMGTFYRVRLGPYADAKEPNQLCTTLKPQGFDCLVVTQ